MANNISIVIVLEQMRYVWQNCIGIVYMPTHLWHEERTEKKLKQRRSPVGVWEKYINAPHSHHSSDDQHHIKNRASAFNIMSQT